MRVLVTTSKFLDYALEEPFKVAVKVMEPVERTLVFTIRSVDEIMLFSKMLYGLKYVVHQISYDENDLHRFYVSFLNQAMLPITQYYWYNLRNDQLQRFNSKSRQLVNWYKADYVIKNQGKIRKKEQEVINRLKFVTAKPWQPRLI